MPDNKFLIQEDILVIGNQAADLDSSVSAFTLAEFLNRKNPDKVCRPLIQGHPRDLRLKPEIERLFQRAGISLKPENFSNLYFTEDLSENAPEMQKSEKVIMVDHNMPDSQESIHGIAGIVDHHEDSCRYRNLILRDIRLCGSCASIISEYWHEEYEEIPYEISLLLAGAIAVDTGCLDPLWGKTTDLDRREFDRNNSSLKAEDSIFIQELLNIKNDLSHLSMTDQLRRDYKDFRVEGLKAGISSVPMGQKDFFNEDFYRYADLKEFKEYNCPDLLIIMHTIPSPFSRELSVYTDKNELLDTVKTALSGIDTAGFEFTDPSIHASCSQKEWAFYSQKNVKISRKGLIPLLARELEKLFKP